jgi:hypothetical protein
MWLRGIACLVLATAMTGALSARPAREMNDDDPRI